MKTQKLPFLKTTLRALALALSIAGVCTAQTPAPSDLTAAGAIDAIKARTDVPRYDNAYNLGSTGLRGWVDQIWYLPGNAGSNTALGKITDASRQILVTVASTPGSAVVAVDDVILGAVAASSGTVPSFTSDARKAFGTAITNAEKTGAGTLRVKRWRAGTTTDVNIPVATLGTYSATAPYSCPKSSLILANARDQMVGKLLADPDYLGGGHAGAINALALLASVVPGHPNYAAVQTHLQTYARSLTVPASGEWTWIAAYQLIFLSEYYLLTSDSQVVPVINGSTVRFAKGQGMFGTFGHGMGAPHPDGSGRMIIPPYGPVNCGGNVANLAIVLGKKALLAASQPIDPAIDVAIQRSSGFMGSHINKGAMQYGEHFPFAGSYATNSKDATAALFFGLQNDKTVQTEYFARMSISSWIGGELGHTGQGWGSLWNALGAGMGGEAAASGHFKQLLWRYDIQRRTDGSFTYDTEQGASNDYYGGKTADGTYLGETTDYGVKGSSLYLLTYSLPLKRLYITGKDLNTAYNHDLDATKVAHAVSAASYALDRTGQSIAQLFTALGDYDPHVRHFASLELASRSLTSTDLTNLRNLLNDTNPNLRGSAAQALGYLQDSTALPTLVARLSDTDHWVRQKAANAIRYYANTAAVSVHRDAMLAAFIANGPADPDTIDWSDPLQFSNGQLGQLLFGDSNPDGEIFPRYSIAASTANAPKATHLYPALRIGLLLPSGRNRNSTTRFVKDYLSSADDAQALFPEVVEVQSYIAPGDTMFGSGPRSDAMDFLAASKIKEGIPLALSMLEEGATDYSESALSALASYGDIARYTLPTLRGYLATWDPQSALYSTLLSTIATIENAITAPPTIPGLCVANSQAVATTGAKAITLTGASPRGAFSFLNVTQPANGTLTGTAPNLTYTPNSGYSGMDQFTFRTKDSMTTSDPATVSIIVGSAAGTGIVGAYFNNADFTSPVLTRTDPQINFDWGTGSPDGSIGADTFSARWDGLLRVPETGTYTFSTLNSDGARLYINGQMVIDDFVDQTTNWTDSVPVNLTAGQLVDLQMFHYENTGSAVAKLRWTGPAIAGASGDIIGSQWLYDGAGMTLTPYAHAQTVTLLKDTSIPITLTGSGGTLTYEIVTSPAQGTLQGTAPNLTYTPPAGFSGSVSFTFRVNNGTSDSANATVSINVQAGNLSSFTWASAVSGNWSDAARWTPGLPTTAGLPYYALNFTNSGTYTATHNLSNGFQLNQLNTEANVTFAGTNSLSFVANGGTLPQFNQNGPNAVTLSLPVTLQAMTKMGGSGTGSVTMTGTISGSGGIIKSSDGELSIDQDNTYSGGTIINAGKLRMEWDRNSALGTGPITINGGTLGGSRNTVANPIIVNGGKIEFGSGWGTTLNGSITLNGDLTVIVNHTEILNLSGTISGAGGLIAEPIWYEKYQFGTYSGLMLSGSNTYTGKTIVRKFITMICTTAAALGSGPLEISNFARVNLAFTGTKAVASLTLDGTVMPPGTYGSSTSPATNKNDTYFYGNGTVTVSNNAPVATAQSVSTAEDAQKAITLTGTDADGSPLTYSIVSYPAYGTLSGTAPNVTYIPAVDYHGADSFTFRVNDGTVNSAVATVSIIVTPVDNDPPAFAYNPIIFGGAYENVAYTGQTLAGWANDPDGSALTYSKVSGPAWLAVAPDGSLTGTPDSSNRGLNSFVVRATDSTSATASATLEITVNFVPTLPDGLPGLILQLDASQLTGLSDGDPVATWNDMSGLANHATTSAGTPIYKTGVLNGRPVVRFDDNSAFTTANLSSQFPSAATVFIVTTITGDGAYTLVKANPNVDEWWRWNGDGLSYPGFFRSSRIEGYCPMPDSGSHVFAISSSASAWEMSINGTSQGVAGGNYNSGGALVIGNGSSGGGLNGDISEVLAYNRVLTPNELNTIGSYLEAKYGLATSYDPPLVYISTLNPADNATGVVGGANLVATFSENIVKGTGNITVKNLTDATQTTIAVTDAQVTVSGATLTINPTANLLGGKNYAVQIAATAIDDTVGNSFAGITNDTTWNFTTNSAPVFSSDPITSVLGANSNVPYTGQTLAGLASDADAGDTLTYQKISGPAWLVVASNGALSGTPGSGDVGLNIFVIRATDSKGASVDATLQITVVGLPSPWVSQDIGTGMLAGSAGYNAGTFTQAGSGTVGSTSDKLRYTYQTLTGDGEIIAKISVLQNTGTSSRVGVMIRDTLATNSKEIFMGMTGTNAYRWLRRTTTGGTTTSTSSSTGTVPNTWVRLVRSGTTITAYKSTNGTTWTSVGSTTSTTFASTCYIGLAVASGSTTTLNTSKFGNVTVVP
jgi:autotransporter-associated beta strand protein